MSTVPEDRAQDRRERKRIWARNYYKVNRGKILARHKANRDARRPQGKAKAEGQATGIPLLTTTTLHWREWTSVVARGMYHRVFEADLADGSHLSVRWDGVRASCWSWTRTGGTEYLGFAPSIAAARQICERAAVKS